MRRVPVLLLLAVACTTAPSTAAAQTASDGRIAFVTERDGNAEIYVVNPDGSGLRRITSNPASESEPAISPDGSRIAFVSDRDGDVELYVMNHDGSGQTRVTSTAGPDMLPAWSPDGSKIAFVRERNGNSDIYVIDDSRIAERLTNEPGSDTRPAWSPDGGRIAFQRDFQIFVMNSDGTTQRNIAASPLYANANPSWSPNGRKLAFDTNRDLLPEIYAMNPDGSGATRLTSNAFVDVYPVWSPSSARIALATGRGGNDEVYTMSADGSAQTNLTNNPAFDGFPSWGLAPGEPPPPGSLLPGPADSTGGARGPKVVISRRPVRVTRSGVARIRVACALEPGGCSGVLRLQTARRVRGRFVRVGSRRFVVRPGRTTVVRVRLSRRARRLLVRARRLRVKATVVARNRAGASSATTGSLTLKAPRRRGGGGRR